MNSEGEGSEFRFSWVPCAKFCARHAVSMSKERDLFGCEFQEDSDTQ